MFHTFDGRPQTSTPNSTSASTVESLTGTGTGAAVTVTAGTPSRKVNKSCSECTRRKIKCDGGFPCASCQYYKKSSACEYRQRSKRHVASRSALDQAFERVHTQERILKLLFPSCTLDQLSGKSRDDLLHLISLQPPSSAVRAPTISSPDDHDRLEPTADDPDDDSTQASENGEPVDERRWDESTQQPPAVSASDDINAIGLATDRHRRSYLGVTSMSAVLKALFRLCPAAKDRTVEKARSWAADAQLQPQQQLPPPPLQIQNPGFPPDPDRDPLREQRCIEFYFEHIHAITPLLDEDEFRATSAANNRHDSSWLGLLYMVLTLGSIASGGSDTLHLRYYNRARAYIDLDTLGSGNLESLQALCLLGGYYLHYRNSPNMAYAVLGAAHRVAIALGLHREPSSRRANDHHMDPEAVRRRYAARLETRRRTWWSLFCLDTWASMTLGRPTCGRWDSSTMDTLLPSPLFPDDVFAASLKSNCEFCHICNRIQHRFAQMTRITALEATALDRELQEWYASVPDMLKLAANSPPRMAVAREFQRNRYLNVRLILSRSFLLYLAHDKSHHGTGAGTGTGTGTEEPDQRGDQEKMAETCQAVASEAIDAITLYWTPNHVHVWNSAWYLFQACMVPLLSLAMETRQGGDGGAGSTTGTSSSVPMPDSQVAKWCGSLSKALEIFAEMRPWMRSSDRAPDIVAALFQAVKEGVEGPLLIRTPSATDGGLDLFGWCDEQLTELDWNMFLGDEGVSPNMFSFT